ITKRVVCTPDFEQLYRRADEISNGAGEASEVFDEGLQGAGLISGGPGEGMEVG
ncbi:unnamed protein product, partial [Ascophyllum nodosum]